MPTRSGTGYLVDEKKVEKVDEKKVTEVVADVDEKKVAEKVAERDVNGWSPDLVRRFKLVDININMEYVSRNSNHPVCVICSYKHTPERYELFRYLVDDLGDDIAEECTNHTSTPLMSAMCLDQPEWVHILLSMGADINYVTTNRHGVEHWSVYSDNMDLVYTVLRRKEKPDWSLVTESGRVPAFFLASARMAQFLWDRVPKSFIRVSFGCCQSVLHSCLTMWRAQSSFDLIKFLVHHKACLTQRDIQLKYPLDVVPKHLRYRVTRLFRDCAGPLEVARLKPFLDILVNT